MAKLALCIKRADAPQAVIDAFNGTAGMLIPIPPSFWETKVELVDRAICETDETWLQLLPYIAINADQKVFMYTRGGAGEEARLHGNYSLGVGGHVDVAPDEDFADTAELLNVIRKEGAREIEEEINVSILPAVLHPTFFICDPTNSVGRVHLGLLISYELGSKAIDFVNGLEAGTIENARMIGAEELHTEAVYGRLENWSQIVADAFYADYAGAPDTAAVQGDDNWDDPQREVGGELIAGEGAEPDTEAEEELDDGMGVCDDCTELEDDCTCNPSEDDVAEYGTSDQGTGDGVTGDAESDEEKDDDF